MSLDGLIILDKPPGHTSHEITSFVKKITGAKRTGHAGTLDPDVSGVLPVALGRATKLLRYIAGETKTYIGIIKFRKVQTKEQIEELFRTFTGELVQTPPKISAVRKVPRKRTVYYLKLLEISDSNPRLALFEAKVDAGTYIRTLCEDIGKRCGGARMEELRRIAVGNIRESQTVTMQDVVDAMWLLKNKKDGSLLKKIIRPAENFIDLPIVTIKNSAIDSIRSGAQIAVPAVVGFQSSAFGSNASGGLGAQSPMVSRNQKVSLFSEDGRFVGVGVTQISSDELKNQKKGIAIRLERVQI